MTRFFTLALAATIAAVIAAGAATRAAAQAPGIAIEGSGTVGTSVTLHLAGAPGDWYILYVGLLPQPVASWTGQRLGIGSYYAPVGAGRFDATGRATFVVPIPVIQELVGIGMPLFQFETFSVQVFPPSWKAKNVSPGAYFVVAPAGSARTTTFGLDPTDSRIGQPLTFRMKGEPGDFLVAYFGLAALPVLLPDNDTVIGVLPPYPFTSLLSRFAADGTFTQGFGIPDSPAIVGINAYFQFQSFTLGGFPPQLTLRDSSGCLLITVKG